MKLENKELYSIKGGALNITGTLVTSIVKGLSLIIELGRGLGTAIRMAYSKRSC